MYEVCATFLSSYQKWFLHPASCSQPHIVFGQMAGQTHEAESLFMAGKVSVEKTYWIHFYTWHHYHQFNSIHPCLKVVKGSFKFYLTISKIYPWRKEAKDWHWQNTWICLGPFRCIPYPSTRLDLQGQKWQSWNSHVRKVKFLSKKPFVTPWGCSKMALPNSSLRDSNYFRDSSCPSFVSL